MISLLQFCQPSFETPKNGFAGIKNQANFISFGAKKQSTLTYRDAARIVSDESSLLVNRRKYKPMIPSVFTNNGVTSINNVSYSYSELPATDQIDGDIKAQFPLTYEPKKISVIRSKEAAPDKKVRKIGVILSGGPAPGGHNIISGLYDALKTLNEKNELYGFIGGPDGIIRNKCIKIDDNIIDSYRNTGGFDLLETGRTKLDKIDQFQAALSTCKELGLTGIVIAGGDDSNTNAAFLAEWLKGQGEDIQVIGCPKTIDGDLKSETIETSFGFDTATKTYANKVSVINTDNLSTKKYWQFIRLMGRAASNVTLEVALQTHPNITLISEEKKGLNQIVKEIADTIIERYNNGKNYGSILIPEGLIDFVPELKELVDDLAPIVKNLPDDEEYWRVMIADKLEYVHDNLSERNAAIFSKIRELIVEDLIFDKCDVADIVTYLEEKKQTAIGKGICTDEGFRLLIEELNYQFNELKTDKVYDYTMQDTKYKYISRQLQQENRKLFNSFSLEVKIGLCKATKKDSHGNYQLTQIKTEQLLIDLVKDKIKQKTAVEDPEVIFNLQSAVCAYDGRCDFPTNFDANYCYSLGYNAAALLKSGVTGYFSAIQNLNLAPSKWKAVGIPITSMMNMEVRDGASKAVVKKALVDLDGNPYRFLVQNRERWRLEDQYRRVGPAQLYGPQNVTNSAPMTLILEKAV